MSGFAVDLPLLEDLVERMAACSQRLTEVQDDVDHRVQRLHASWQGLAAAEHAEAHRRWLEGARQMNEALRTLHAVAETAERNYGEAVRTNRRMWAS